MVHRLVPAGIRHMQPCSMPGRFGRCGLADRADEAGRFASFANTSSKKMQVISDLRAADRKLWNIGRHLIKAIRRE